MKREGRVIMDGGIPIGFFQNLEDARDALKWRKSGFVARIEEVDANEEAD